MDFPKRTSLLERARESMNHLQGKEPPKQSPAIAQPTREPAEAARMAAAINESGPATAAIRGEVTTSSAKAIGELTPSHTPGHVPENMNQWRARAEAQLPARPSVEAPAPATAPVREPRREEDRVTADAATKPRAPAENRSKELER
jgi:hypothetical protein